jgi:hypothetical protein
MAREATQGASPHSTWSADIHAVLQVENRICRLVIKGNSPTSKNPLSDLAFAWHGHGCHRNTNKQRITKLQ